MDFCPPQTNIDKTHHDRVHEAAYRSNFTASSLLKLCQLIVALLYRI